MKIVPHTNSRILGKLVPLLPILILLTLASGLRTHCAQFSFVAGNYYSSVYSTRIITQYDPAGTIVGSFTVTEELEDGLRGLAFGPDGLLYVSVPWDRGFKILVYDASLTLRVTYSGNVYVRGNLGYGKLAIDNKHLYIAGQQQLTRFELGQPTSGVSIYHNNQVFDVDLMPNGNLLVLSAYALDEITPDGTIVRNFPYAFADARGVEYDPASNKLFVTQFGLTSFSWPLMRFDWTTAVMEAETPFWYGEDIFLLQSGMLLVGSSASPPVIFRQDLTQVGALSDVAQMFVTEFVPRPRSSNAPPILNCPLLTVIECGTDTGLTAQISDPDGDAMALVWILNGNAVETNWVAAGPPGFVNSISLSNSFVIGTNRIEIAATDGTNVTACSSTIVVVDNTPPVLSNLSASPTLLWPPNRRMVEIRIKASVSDACGLADWRLTGVTWNEPANFRSHRNTRVDWTIDGDKLLLLRAERTGPGEARIYSINVQASDVSGNKSEMQTVTVTVPQNPGESR